MDAVFPCVCRAWSAEVGKMDAVSPCVCRAWSAEVVKVGAVSPCSKLFQSQRTKPLQEAFLAEAAKLFQSSAQSHVVSPCVCRAWSAEVAKMDAVSPSVYRAWSAEVVKMDAVSPCVCRAWSAEPAEVAKMDAVSPCSTTSERDLQFRPAISTRFVTLSCGFFQAIAQNSGERSFNSGRGKLRKILSGLSAGAVQTPTFQLIAKTTKTEVCNFRTFSSFLG